MWSATHVMRAASELNFQEGERLRMALLRSSVRPELWGMDTAQWGRHSMHPGYCSPSFSMSTLTCFFWGDEVGVIVADSVKAQLLSQMRVGRSHYNLGVDKKKFRYLLLLSSTLWESKEIHELFLYAQCETSAFGHGATTLSSLAWHL